MKIPQRYARTDGALYLAIIVLGAFAEGFVTNKSVVPGNAATTAHHILAPIACFAALFAAAFADLIIPAILVPPLIGESSFCLWLLVKGVNITKWKERLGDEPGVEHILDIDRSGNAPSVRICVR